MNVSLLESVLRRVAPLAAEGRASDADLLRLFASTRDESAFATLVQRHGPMVWSVCRNLLPVEADAEDAFQATFVALIGSAGKIRTPGALSSWLYGVAYRVAQKAKRSAARRHRHEQSAASGEASSPVAPHTWNQLQAAVHDELNRLPEPLRAAFVICELEGVGQREAAQTLGLKLGTLSARLTKARQRLMERLSKQGIASGLAVAGALAGGSATATAPAKLLSKVLVLAQSGPNWSESIPSTILQLARAANEVSMMRTKMLAAAIALVVTLMAGSATLLVPLATAQRPAQNKPGTPLEGQSDAASQYQDLAVATQSASQWEYKFVPHKSDSLEEFEKILTTAGATGWEYCGIERLLSSKQRPEVQHPKIIFKRLKSSASADRVMLDTLERARTRSGTGRAASNSNSNSGITGSFGATGPIGGEAAGGGMPTAPMGGMSPSSPPGIPRPEIHIVRLENASADSLAQVLTQLFAGHGRVLPESRTNSLLIQADKDTLLEINAIIQKLDTPGGKTDNNPFDRSKRP